MTEVTADAEMRPWVSILTPVYNGWEYLEQCALSVFMQHTGPPTQKPFFRWEWIIGVNGHGESGGAALEAARRVAYLASISHLDDIGCKVQIVNLPTVKGKVEALNSLVALTDEASPWIAVLDCDDTWQRDKLICQWLTAQRLPDSVAVIGTLCSYFGEYVSKGPQLPREFIQGRSLLHGNPIINSSAIIRREYAHWEDRFGLEDYDLWFRILQGAGKLAFNIPRSLVYHRIHAGSAFNGKGVQDIEGLREYYRLKSEGVSTGDAGIPGAASAV